MYNPWVGGGPQYAFGRQPQAAAVNLAGLAPSFIELVQLAGAKEGLSKAERDAAVDEIREAVQMGYVDTFHAKVRVRVRDRVRVRVRVRVRARVRFKVRIGVSASASREIASRSARCLCCSASASPLRRRACS